MYTSGFSVQAFDTYESSWHAKVHHIKLHIYIMIINARSDIKDNDARNYKQ